MKRGLNKTIMTLGRRRRCPEPAGAMLLVLMLLVPLVLAPMLLPTRACGASGADQAVPEAHQVPILFKLLTYDRTLWKDHQPRLVIGLLHHTGQPESQANLAAMQEALTLASDKTVNRVKFTFTTISWGTPQELQAELQASDIDVLYVTAGHEQHLTSIQAITREKGVLTMTGTPAYVHEGLSVGLNQVAGRPQLEVNLESLSAEGHQLDARVLRLCKVVDR